MERRKVIVGVDGVLWGGNLSYYTYLGLVKGKKAQKEARRVFTREQQPYKKNVLEAIGERVEGRKVRQVQRAMNPVAEKFARFVDTSMLERLGQLSRKQYEIILMSSAPDFIISSAIIALNQTHKAGISQETFLASTYEVEDNTYSGYYDLLDKKYAVAQMLRNEGVVNRGLVNGLSDLKWINEYCVAFEPINPGTGLVQAISTKEQLRAMIA